MLIPSRRCLHRLSGGGGDDCEDQTVWEVFEEERCSLVPYTGPFDRCPAGNHNVNAGRDFHAAPASVSKTCLIRFDKNRYSVDARSVGRPVEVRAYAERIECWQEGKIVGQHQRVFGRDYTIYDPLHYIRYWPASLVLYAPLGRLLRNHLPGSERSPFQGMGITNGTTARSTQTQRPAEWRPSASR